jgi:hypothetical protein
MKDRLLTIAGGLLAFVLVVVLLVPVQRDESDRISRPLSTDRGRAGLQGLARWLEEGRVPTDALRRRYAALSASLDLSPRGNLLIISLPQRKPSRLDERQALRRWLAQGNNALVLVAAGDTPRWVATSAGSTTGGFLESFGFEFDAERDEGAEQGETEEGEAEEGNPCVLWIAAGLSPAPMTVGRCCRCSPRPEKGPHSGRCASVPVVCG